MTPFTFGYGAGTLNPQDKSPDNQLWVKYGQCSRETGTFREELVKTARQVSEKSERIGRTPMVLLSGGLDSQVAVYAFIEAGAKFECVSFKYKYGLNIQETYWINRFLTQYNVPHRWIDIDAYRWVESPEAEKLFIESYAPSMGVVAHMYLMDMIWFRLNGYPVLCAGELYMERHVDKWVCVEVEQSLAWYRYALQRDIPEFFLFFQQNAEVIHALAKEPVFAQLVDGRLTCKDLSARKVKFEVYKKYWPELEYRPKYGGKELVKSKFDSIANSICADKIIYNDKWFISLDDLLLMLQP